MLHIQMKWIALNNYFHVSCQFCKVTTRLQILFKVIFIYLFPLLFPFLNVYLCFTITIYYVYMITISLKVNTLRYIWVSLMSSLLCVLPQSSET